MQKTFVAIAEEMPGSAWQAWFRKAWPQKRDWFLRDGLAARPTAAEARLALSLHMPELVSIYDRLCHLAGAEEVMHRALACYNPPSVLAACSQLVWTGAGGPALIRNYDFQVDFPSGRIELQRWNGRRVICMVEAAWGCLDGMNQDGLVVSLTFGGRQAEGKGFAMPLILRYVLETCRTVAEAVAVLTRIPVPMAQNVIALDRSGAHATVFLGADREPAVSSEPLCTNHQEEVGWPAAAASNRTVERKAALARNLADPAASLVTLIEGLLRPPLYVIDAAKRVATVYSAVYRPAAGTVDYVWPGKSWRQSFDAFAAGGYTHHYAAPLAGGA